MSSTLGIIAAFITLACWTIGTFSFTRASQLYDPGSVNRVRLLYAAVLLSIVTCAVGRISPASLFSIPSGMHWVWLGISGIVGLSIGDHFAFSAYKIMGSSRTSLFNTFAPGAALIGGYIMLGEHIHFIGLTGMAISVSGIIWFIQSRSSREDDAIDRSTLIKGLVYATLGALCQGFGLVFAKKGLVLDLGDGRLNPLHATWIRMFVATVAIYASGLLRVNMIRELKDVMLTPAILRPVSTGTLFGPVIGVSMSLYAASVIEVSLAQTIFSLLPVSVILTAFVLGKEKLELRSLVAALIGVGGVFVLVWRDDILALFR
jgi:drug/metabolite transporter (DMT)-like permease